VEPTEVTVLEISCKVRLGFVAEGKVLIHRSEAWKDYAISA
jgi:sRNA-binding carbon storage regulator CsrA